MRCVRHSSGNACHLSYPYSLSAFTRLPTISRAKAPPNRVAASTSWLTVRNRFWSGMNSSAPVT